MRTRALLHAVPLLLPLLLGGCGDPDSPARDGAEPDASSPLTADPLLGRTFLGDGISVEDEVVAVPGGARLEISFREVEHRGVRTVDVRAGCNHLSADYSLQDDTLATTSVGGTDMGCDPERHAFDDLVVELLGRSPRFELDGDELTLRSGDGDRRLEATLLDAEVADPAPPLEGTAWTLTSLIEGDTVSSAPGPTSVTLTLDGGAVAVDTGCNGLVGIYELAGDMLTITTDVESPESCGVELDELESTLTDVLDGDLSIAQDRQSLTMLRDDGTGLGFRAAD